MADKLAYKIFLVQFENCVLGLHDKALKLLIFKNHLRGHALKIVSHLSISADSFDVALEILSGEYLDKAYMVEQIFLTIDAAKPARKNDFSSIRDFMAEMKSLLFELRNPFSLDFLEDDTPGNRYFSHLLIH